ncbi:MAG: hypothetical protein Q4Q62_06185 [Thermoplasmata archaeon]|nr:hypothetical protein [Thermoplasmata archaeon]
MFARDAQNHVAAVERMKERIGLRWTEDVDSVDVTVRSSGLGWDAFSSRPEIHCHGRTPSDAVGFYRFCLEESRTQ